MTPQQTFRSYMKAVGSESAEAVSRHLSQERMIALYQGRLPAAEGESAREHLAQCPECLELWRDVRDFCAPAEAGEAGASEVELRREWKELWGKIQSDSQAGPAPPAPLARPSVRVPRALALAAGVLLTLGLGAVSLLWWQERQQRLRAQTAVATLQAAQQDLSARINQLEQTGKIQPSLEEALRQERVKRQELETRLSELNQPQTNQPIYELLLAGNARGAGAPEPGQTPAYRINVPAAARSFSLRLAPEAPEKFSAYTVEILNHQNRLVWKSEPLKLDQSESLVITFPRGFLSEGEYLLRLTGWKTRTPKLIGQYDLTLSFARR